MINITCIIYNLNTFTNVIGTFEAYVNYIYDFAKMSVSLSTNDLPISHG